MKTGIIYSVRYINEGWCIEGAKVKATIRPVEREETPVCHTIPLGNAIFLVQDNVVSTEKGKAFCDPRLDYISTSAACLVQP